MKTGIRKLRCLMVFTVLSFFVTTLVVVWISIRPRDALFRGKPENYWIEKLSYRDDAQVKEWREFGPEGVGVLIRALEGANRPKDRIYRQFYKGIGRILPAFMKKRLPPPRMDVTRSTRMKVVDLLASLSKDAMQAAPTMTRALRDEDHSVRQIAISYFTQGEDENVLLNYLEPATKRKLLAEFLWDMQDANDGVRNNALVALRYYPEQAQIVTPVLEQVLKDSDPSLQRLAAEALKRVHSKQGQGKGTSQ